MRRAIGIDIGGTKIAAGVVDLDDGSIRSRREQPTDAARGGDAVLNDALKIAGDLKANAKSIGVGLAELVDRDGIISSNATIDWLNLPARACFENILPTRFEADVRAAARAEARFGAGQGATCFLYITVGTGLSSSLVIDGKPFLGARGLTGTFASAATLVPFDDGAEESPALETFSSGLALANRYLARTGETADARKVAALSEGDDPVAREIVQSAGLALGSAIAQLVNTLDPEFVVVGGGLGCAPGLFHSALRIGFYEHLWSKFHHNIPIHQATLGPDAGIIGAALASIET